MWLLIIQIFRGLRRGYKSLRNKDVCNMLIDFNVHRHNERFSVQQEIKKYTHQMKLNK